ncbi:MAG: leucyl aminopeptidase family protein [Salaquimonas sp.]
MRNNSWPFIETSKSTIPVWFVEPSKTDALKKQLPASAMKWIKANDFSAGHGKTCVIPDEKGIISAVLFGFDKAANPLDCGELTKLLPAGKYHFANQLEDMHLACLGIALGGYQYSKYKSQKASDVYFSPPANVEAETLRNEIEAIFLVRDLINTPTNDMGPEELEKAFRKLAVRFKAKTSTIKGNELLKKNFPMIHAVGRASAQAPRLLDMKWGNAKHPKVTLVGKGVCFDTGGLNIKPGSSMALMKKDMGGAANVLGLAHLVMAAKLPVRLRVLIPAVENSISGNAFRPGDILDSRKGLTVEIGNTDAEGRLVLGDALAYGDEEKPDLMIDMATLTGAARVALGPDLPPFYSDDEDLCKALSESSQSERDPLWRMPLWEPYESMLSSKIADCNHITSGGFAGSVTAALFLKKFVEPTTSWIHFDVFGWVPSVKPWASVGGEAQGIRALFSVLKQKYPKA